MSGEEWQQALEPEERELFAADVEWLRSLVRPEVFESAWEVGVSSPAGEPEPAIVV